LKEGNRVAELKINILVENTVGVTSGVLAEWGLAMLLDLGKN
jgi:metal-dependent hydrolase (beta-lactamase superfamily II)